MLKNQIKFLSVLLLFNGLIQGQDLEFGKVSIQELEEKMHSSDSSAVAAILFNKARTFFINPSVIQTEYVIRIKIYKKEGLNWANFEVPYYVGWKYLKDDIVKFSDCNTYNLVNGKIEKTKLTNEGTFIKSINSYWNKRTITMPNVKVGSVIEIKYILKSENIETLPKFDFQYTVPVNFSQYVTEIPKYYVYDVILSGYLTLEKDFPDKVNSNIAKSIYTMSNIPALIVEDYVDNSNNYRSSLEHELKLTRVRGEIKNIAATWEGVAKSIYEEDKFGKELNKQIHFGRELSDKFPENEIGKMEEILKFVQNKMNWNGNYGYYTDKGVENAILEQTGNVADINFSLILLLRHYGFKANPVLLSTRDNGLVLFPSRTALNYVIAGVELNNDIYLLDATGKYSQLNVLPFRTLNGTGRLIERDGTVTEVILNPNFLSKYQTMINAEIDVNGKIKGQFRSYASDYKTFLIRNNFQDYTNEQHSDRFEKKYPNIQVSNYEIENLKEASKTLNEHFDFELTNLVEKIGDKLYLNPSLFLTNTSNLFVKENRTCPINFGFPFQEKYIFNYTIPEGYEVEHLPESVNISSDNNLSSYKYFIQQNGNKIQLSSTFEILNAEISLNYYESFRVFYKTMVEKQLEKVILRKK